MTIDRSIGRPIGRSIGRSIDRSVDRAVTTTKTTSRRRRRRKNGAKRSENGPKRSENGPKRSENGPKTVSKRFKMVRTGSEKGPKTLGWSYSSAGWSPSRTRCQVVKLPSVISLWILTVNIFRGLVGVIPSNIITRSSIIYFQYNKSKTTTTTTKIFLKGF